MRIAIRDLSKMSTSTKKNYETCKETRNYHPYLGGKAVKRSCFKEKPDVRFSR